jgi:hypothetical protein
MMVFLSHLYISAVFLPRQARDKHRESTQKHRFVCLRVRQNNPSPSFPGILGVNIATGPCTMPNVLGDHRQEEDDISMKANHNDDDAAPPIRQMRGRSSDKIMQIFEDETELTVRVCESGSTLSHVYTYKWDLLTKTGSGRTQGKLKNDYRSLRCYRIAPSRTGSCRAVAGAEHAFC